MVFRVPVIYDHGKREGREENPSDLLALTIYGV